MIRRVLEANGERELYTGVDARGQRTWSLRANELLAAVGGWQAELRTRGVRPGDRVGFDLPRGPELLPAHIARPALPRNAMGKIDRRALGASPQSEPWPG